MRVILGIGNTGIKYENTRHNIGFMILDAVAKKNRLDFHPSKGEYYYAGSFNKTSPFILVKPVTYVNLTGIAAEQIVNEYEINVTELLVVSDDVNLPIGKIRVRKSGGDGGHNGLASIIYHLESNQFPRLRFGIGNQFETGMMSEYVLTKFSKDEMSNIENSIEFSVNLIEEFIKNGFDSMLSYYSQINNKINNISINEQSEGK